MRVSLRCSRRGWRASVNGNRDSLAGSRTDPPVSNDAAGLGPGSRVIALATGCGMHQERLCAWPISGDRRDHTTRGAVKPPFHDAPCHRTSRSPIRDKIELLAIRQEILARVCPAQEAAANDLETQEFSPRASQVGIRLRLGGALRWTAGLVSFVEPYAGSRRRPIPFRRTPRSQLPRWDFMTSVPQKFLPVRACWVIAELSHLPSPLFVSLLRRQRLQEVTHVM